MSDSVIDGFLVIVSCGKDKIWRSHPLAGPTRADDAYTSSVFKASRRYCRHFAERWVILSAKYGFIDPDFCIPENYNVSFHSSNAISTSSLREQVAMKQLGSYRTVGVLGSDLYWQQVRQAFDGLVVPLRHVNGNVSFPPLFQRLVADSIDSNTPFREHRQT
jgi:hypothetical protein